MTVVGLFLSAIHYLPPDAFTSALDDTTNPPGESVTPSSLPNDRLRHRRLLPVPLVDRLPEDHPGG